MKCETCTYFCNEHFRLAQSGNQSPDDSRNFDAGTCRRYAPSARNNNWRSWPVVLAVDWCHDYKAAEVKPEVKVEAPPPAEATPAPVPETLISKFRKKRRLTK